MASASPALLLARLRSLHAYGVVRPLVATGRLLPARPWLSPPAAVAPDGSMSTAAAVRCFATRRATSSSSSSSSSPRENSRLPSSRPPKETVALDVTDSDSEDTTSDDDSEETASDEDAHSEDTISDSDVEKSISGGSASENYTTLLDGCDFEHWLVVMEPPPGDPSDPDTPRDEIIDGYIATLAQVVGSVEKARKKIYSVSTRHYFAFGACIQEQLSHKLKGLPKVRWVLPDSYLDAKTKDYGGEPFINGKAVPYDPKYHEVWVRNNARVPRNHRPRSYVRRENMQNFQNRDVPTGQQRLNSPSPPVQQTVEPHDVPPVVHHAKGDDMPPPPAPLPNNGDPPTYQHHVESPQGCDAPGSGQNFQQSGALVHQVDNQDRQDNPAGGENQGCPNNHDDNLHTYQANADKSNDDNGRQGECSCYQNGSAAGQPPLHGANAPSHQGCYRDQAVHRYYNCHVHYHYYY